MNTPEILEKFEGVKKQGDGWQAKCKAHDDETASLSIATGSDRRTLLNCKAGCSTEAICEAIGIKISDLFAKPKATAKKRKAKSKITKTYDYIKDGVLRFQAVRMEPKDFRQRQPNGRDGWTWNLKGVTPFLYNHDSVVAADHTAPIFLPEGEKDADNLAALGLIATCCPMGAGKWRESYSDAVRSKHVVILIDNDGPGRKHGEQVAASLWGKAASVKIVEPPNLPLKGDVSDWLDAGGTKEQLLELVEQTQPVTQKDVDGFAAATEKQGEKYKPLMHGIVLPSAHPSDVAKAFEEYSREKVEPVHHKYNGFDGWSIYHNGQYQPVQDIGEIEDHLGVFMDMCITVKQTKNGEMPVKLPVSNSIIATIIKQLRRLDDVKIPPSKVAPCYLGDCPDWPEHKYIFVMKNCILDTRTYPPKKLKHTPDYYTFRNFPYNYNPDAISKTKVWRRWSLQAFADKTFEQPCEEDTLILHEWFGLFLAGDTSEQRLFEFIGPTRSGKGTAIHVLEKLLPGQWTGTTLTELGTQFGLENLVGKALAISGDERSQGYDRNIDIAVGRLKAISGGAGEVSVNRKGKPIVNAKINCNFLFASNSTLTLPDPSGVIADRFTYLVTEISYLGREDKNLWAKLDKETEGIFCLCLQALDGYRKRGKLLESKRGADQQSDARDEANCIIPFLRDWCEFDDVEDVLSIEELTDAYNMWAEKQNQRSISTKGMGRRMAGAMQTSFPNIVKTRPRTKCPSDDIIIPDKETRIITYCGIRLSCDFWDTYKPSQDTLYPGF